MNSLRRNRSLLIFVILLAVLSLGQLVYAQDSPYCPAVAPQWVRDRQQYETSYVYVPMTFGAQPSSIPQWVHDRQQYETSYVYMPMEIVFQPIDHYC